MSDIIQHKPKVVLSTSYFYKKDSKQWSDKKPYPPYGTLVAAAYLKANGYEVNVFDTHLKDDPGEIIPILNAWKPDYVIVYDDGFNYLTKMCLSDMRECAFKICNLAKQSGAQVIVSNSDATDHMEIYFEQGADYIVFGEGEISLLELVNSIETNTDKNYIQGVAYKANDSYIKNISRPVLKQLDSLPMPAWDLIDIESYKKIWMDHQGYFTLNIATTRGCPYKCNWCAKPIYGNRYNSRSASSVVAEIKRLYTHYGVTHFWMADDIFGLTPKWVSDFKTEIKREGISIHYKIQSRADLLLTPNYINELKESGLEEVWIGAESGSQLILDAMDKGITVDEIKQSTLLLKQRNIKVGYFLQFGYPGEKWNEIKQTIQMLLQNMPDDIGVSVSYPLPGTKFYDQVVSQLKAKTNWKDSDDLDMLYQAAYSASFYKRLHRFVHKLFRLKQAWLQIQTLINSKTPVRSLGNKRLIALPYYIVGACTDLIRLLSLRKVILKP